MLQSENLNELFAALSKAQAQFSVAVKDSKNPYYKSNYADLNSVFSAFRDPLAANGLCVSQLVTMIDGQNILVTMLGHSSGQWIKSFSPIITSKQDVQGFGAGITYMRRYALVSMLGISQDDDDGESALTDTEKADRYKEKMGWKSTVPPEKLHDSKAKELELVLNHCDETFVNGVNAWMDQEGYSMYADIPPKLLESTLKKAYANKGGK